MDEFKCFMDNVIIMNGIIKIKQKCGFLNMMALISRPCFTRQQFRVLEQSCAL